jgi:hypothetical protein
MSTEPDTGQHDEGDARAGEETEAHDEAELAVYQDAEESEEDEQWTEELEGETDD